MSQNTVKLETAIIVWALSDKASAFMDSEGLSRESIAKEPEKVLALYKRVHPEKVEKEPSVSYIRARGFILFPNGERIVSTDAVYPVSRGRGNRWTQGTENALMGALAAHLEANPDFDLSDLPSALFVVQPTDDKASKETLNASVRTYAEIVASL